MAPEHLLSALPITLPATFYERLIRDIPAPDWVALIGSAPAVKELIFEGFHTRPDKLARLVRQPQVEVRLRRLLQLDLGFMDLVLDLWGQSQIMLVAFVEMLDIGFIAENWDSLKDLLGPERFLVCLALLDLVGMEEIEEKWDERFWVRNLDAEAAEILLPALQVWRELQAQDPRTAELLGRELGAAERVETSPVAGGEDKERLRQLRREQDRRKKVETKLERAAQEGQDLREELNKSRAETERLESRLKELEKDFEQRLQKELGKERARWFERYRGAGPEVLDRWQDQNSRLDDLFAKADRALELQAKADQEYGLVGEVGRRLIRLESYLREMEQIHGRSLVVHAEVKRTQQALLAEKMRLLQLPGIDRVFEAHPELAETDEWRRRIRFLEPVPANLEALSTLKRSLERLCASELMPDLTTVMDELDHKRRQIQENLYQRFYGDLPAGPSRAPISLDDLVQSGESRKYDLYVDGYNILLRLMDPGPSGEHRSLTQLRDAFIARVLAKGHLFRKIFLVFDGVDGSRERHGNVEIIYSDKRSGSNADAVIIEALGKRRDRKSILVTADREIISATEKRLFGIIEPLALYSLLFDLDFTPLGSKKG